MESEIQHRIETSFAAQTMMQTLGAEIAHISAGSVWIRSPILAGSLQQQGFAHSGLTYSIGDSAAGYSALTVMPLDSEVVTAEIKINLLAPARGDYLLAKGRVLKPGRRLVVVASDVYAVTGGRETHVAALQGTMMPVAL